MVDREQYERVLIKKKAVFEEPRRLSSLYATYNGKSCSMQQLLCRPELPYKDLLLLYPQFFVDYGDDLNTQIEVAVKYEGYITRQRSEVEKLSSIERIELPECFDFGEVRGLRTEAKLRLTKVRPNNLGQASRIPGIAPSDISVLMIALKK
jgi:tRNA uridine 5-carboxymethylaminomethyl modification enzyme